jgi:hypothetical protein
MQRDDKVAPDGGRIRALRGNKSARELAEAIRRKRPTGADWPAISAQTIYNTENTRGSVRIATLKAIAFGLETNWESLQISGTLELPQCVNVNGKWSGFFTELASRDDELELARIEIDWDQSGTEVKIRNCKITDNISSYREVSTSGSLVGNTLLATTFPLGDQWQLPHGLTQWLLEIKSPQLMVGRIIYVRQYDLEVADGRVILVKDDCELASELLAAASESLSADPFFATAIKHPK